MDVGVTEARSRSTAARHKKTTKTGETCVEKTWAIPQQDEERATAP